jgi:xylulokinase
MRRCFEAIAEAASTAGCAVRTLGVSSQGEAFTVLDETGRACCNALVSFDARAATLAQHWTESFGPEKLYQITGHTAHPMFSLFKLLWLREHQPDVLKGARRVLCFEDLLHHRLGVPPAMSWPLAGRTMLFDIRRHEWNSELLGKVGLSADQLARPLPSGSVVGTIPAAKARELGLGEGVLVVTGGHDQPCGGLGAAACRAGQAVYATGTVECITPAFAQLILSDDLRRNNLCTYDHAAPGLYTTVAFSLTGGNVLKWFRDRFGAIEVQQAQATGRDAYSMLMQAVEDRPTDLMVLPYFTPSGTPYFDTETPGAILGLRLTTTRGQVLRALLEGVCFEMLLNLDILRRCGLEVTELRAIGGGAKSEVWTQLKADVLGRPITVLEVVEAGCLGCAVLGRSAVTGQSPVDIASQWARPVCDVRPRAAFRDAYAQRLEEYQRLYATLREFALSKRN